MTPVSAVIITHNEEKYIARCLRSLAWADEILIIDAHSNDKTPDLCQELNQPWSDKVKFIQRKWSGFREQRNFALEQAKNDWVFVIDSDEECSPELADKINSFFSNGGTPPHRAYKVRRQEFFLQKPIHFGIWNPSYQDRFYHRAGVKYVNEIHEYPIFQVQPDRLHEPLLHAPDFAPEKFLGKMNRYTTQEAHDRVAQGQRTNIFRIFFAFPAMFLKNYFYYSAYKDGYHGFVISILEGISRAVRHIKIWQFQREVK